MSNARAEPDGSDRAHESVRVPHGPDDLPPSLAVAEAVADLAGVSADGLGQAGIVLYDSVDLDALDALVAHRSGGGVDVSFTVADYEVTVDREAVVASES